MSYSNWGRINHSTQIFRGCRKVSCEGHGGILVTENAMKTHPYFEKLREFPELDLFYEKGYYVFEEDCDASVFLSVLPDEAYSELCKDYLSKEGNTLQTLRDIDARNLIRNFPELYTFLTGRELSIFESDLLLRCQIQNCETRLHFVAAGWGDWAWDVPEGYVYFVCKDQHEKGWDEGYLMEQAAYRANKFMNPCLPIDVTNLKTFTPNKDLPYSKRSAA